MLAAERRVRTLVAASTKATSGTSTMTGTAHPRVVDGSKLKRGVAARAPEAAPEATVRKSPIATRGSARALPARESNSEADGAQRRDRKQHRDLLAEERCARRRAEPRHAHETHTRAGKHHRQPCERSGQLTLPRRDEGPERRQAGGDEQHRDERDAHRRPSRSSRGRSRRQAMAAPTRAASTRPATASVASASWANSRRATVMVLNGPS